MGKVFVKQAISAQYPVGAGAPVMVLGGGGRRRGGRTGLQRVLGAAGTTAGALSALAGQHRSLGGLVQSAISGGAQGGAIGQSLGRGLSTRGSRAAADRREALRDEYARMQASGEIDRSRFRPQPVRIRDVEAEVQRVQAERDRANPRNERRMSREDRENQLMGEMLRNYVNVRDAGPMRVAMDDSPSLVRVEPPLPALPAPVIDVEPEEPVRGAVDAAGKPVQVIGPSTPVQMPPPPGSIGDPNEGDTAVEAEATKELGFNTVDENRRPATPLSTGDATNAQIEAMARANRERVEQMAREAAERRAGMTESKLPEGQQTLL